MSARTRLQVDERRAQLLALGLRLFAHTSYDAVSVDDIARGAGVSKGLLYHYFGSKRDFYVAVVREAAERLEEATATDPALPPRERAAQGLTAYLDFVDAHAEAFVALMRGGLGADAEIAAVIDDVRERLLARFLQGIGLSTPRPAYRAAIRAWIGAVEAASLDWLRHRDVDRATLLALLLPSLAAHLAAAARVDPDPGADAALSALVTAFPVPP